MSGTGASRTGAVLFAILLMTSVMAGRDGTAVQNAPGVFEFNSDGTFSILDVQALFAEEAE